MRRLMRRAAAVSAAFIITVAFGILAISSAQGMPTPIPVVTIIGMACAAVSVAIVQDWW